MNFLENNKHLQNAFIVASIFGISLFSYNLINSPDSYTQFWPAAGFVLGYYIMFGKKSFPAVVVGLTLGHIIPNLLYSTDPIYLRLLLGIILVGADIVFILLFKYILSLSNVDNKLTGNGSIMHIIALSLSSFVFAAIVSTFNLILLDDIDFLKDLLLHLTGYLGGGFLFGFLLIFSSYYHKEDTIVHIGVVYQILFVLGFVIFSVLIFNTSGNSFQYDFLKYIFLALFFITAFLFNYSMIINLSILLLFFAHSFYLNNIPAAELSLEVSNVNLFIVAVVISASVTRVILLEVRRKSYKLHDANDQLEDLVSSTFTLLKLGEKQQFQEEFNSNEYIKDLFNVAKKIFKNYDAASCYVRGEEFVNFIDTENYNLELLNNYEFRIEDFQWSKEIPEHVVGSSKMQKQSLKHRYNKFLEQSSKLKETIKFTLFLEEDTVGGMSFDIFAKSGKRFTKIDYENIRSFQSIMNSFYKTRYLISKNNSLRDEIVLSLIRTLELYDQYTGGHSEEVASIGQMIAARMGLTNKEQYDVFWAGIVHDIGKVGIPSDILNKPERLSLEEYDIIKAHPGFGYEILKRSEDLQHIAKLVKHHHEWWNGSGYPDGLKAEEIPLGARIIQCADAVSSMATKRPYTEIKSSEQILKEIKLYKGSQFAPDVADAMIDFIEEGLLDKYYLERIENIK